MTRPRRPESLQQPLYARILRLRHLTPGGFLCFVFLEGAIALGILLALAELVSWWGVLVLPATVAVMVKLNDLIAGALTPPARPTATRAPAATASTPRTGGTGPVRADGHGPAESTPRPAGPGPARADAHGAAATRSGAQVTARRPVPGQAVGTAGPSAAMAQAGGPESAGPGESTTRLPGFVAGSGVPVKRPWAERLEADQQRARHSAARRYE